MIGILIVKKNKLKMSKSKKISSYYSKLRKLDKDSKDDGFFMDQGNEALVYLLLRYMGDKRPFSDYHIDIPPMAVYSPAETGDWSELLEAFEDNMSDVKKNGAKLEVTDNILKKIESKSDLIMDYIKNGKLDPKLGINNFGDARDPEFLESII
jgi:hypothetical protein